VEDHKKAILLIDKPAPVSTFEETKLLEDPIDIKNYLRAAGKSGLVAVDLETDMFDPRNEILGMSMCYKSEGAYYPVYIEWKHIEESDGVSILLEKVLTSKAVTKVFQNIDFDWKFLHFHGFSLDGPLHDTMIMAFLKDENFSVGLKQRTWTDLDYGGYDLELDKYKVDQKFTKNSSYKDIPLEIMYPYAGTDTLATLHLYEKFTPELKDLGVWPLYEKISMPVRRVMTEASINGIYVNMVAVNKLRDRLEESMNIISTRILDLIGREDFNFMSSQQLGNYLFDELKAPGGVRTKTEKWKADKTILNSLAVRKGNRKYTKIAKDVLMYKYMDKCLGTYLGQAERFVWDEDGRVHSQYNSTGAVTGRVSNSKPCTHNIPRDGLIRSLYRATPGNVIVEADIKAAEMRTIAVESGDEVLLEIIERGGDIHNMTFNEMFGKEIDYVPTADERRIAKSINFGLVYGITAIGLSRRLGVKVDIAQEYINTYFEKFSGVAKWVEETVEFARENGYVLSLFRRRRTLVDILNDDKYVRWRAERQAMNSPIQSAAADYTYIGLIRIYKMLRERHLKAKIIHTVHDCVLIDCPLDEVEIVKKIVKKAFLTPVKAFPMEMDIDIEVHECWGQGNKSPLDLFLKEITT
jgi:DNA polymerase-1